MTVQTATKRNARLETETPARLFKALMHPCRLAILDILRGGEACVCHLEAALGYRQAYISQHLMMLREAGLVQDRREGYNVYYHVTWPQVYAVLDAARQSNAPELGQEAVELMQVTTAGCLENCSCPHCTSNKIL